MENKSAKHGKQDKNKGTGHLPPWWHQHDRKTTPQETHTRKAPP